MLRELGDGAPVRGDVHTHCGNRRVHIAYRKDRHRFAVRSQRVDYLGDPGKCDRVPEDPATRLVIRVTRPANPPLAPGDQAVGLQLAEKPRNLSRRFPVGDDGGVREVEEEGFRVEDLRGAMPLLLPPLADFAGGKRPERLRLLPSGEPDDYDSVAPCSLRKDRPGNSELIIRVREPDDKRLFTQLGR